MSIGDGARDHRLDGVNDGVKIVIGWDVEAARRRCRHVDLNEDRLRRTIDIPEACRRLEIRPPIQLLRGTRQARHDDERRDQQIRRDLRKPHAVRPQYTKPARSVTPGPAEYPFDARGIKGVDAR